MELDLSEIRIPLLTLAAILLLASLGWLGNAYIPSGDKPLTRSEWQVLKARRAYLKELGEMQAAAETLATAFNSQPDPVRTQITAERIQLLTSEGQPALEYQREKLALAAQAVSDWAVGAMARETAFQALDEAIQALSPQPTPAPTPTPTLDSARIPAIQFIIATSYEALNAG
jgi:phosphoglycolate phosphatase-like HAD superfamily hydrolase